MSAAPHDVPESLAAVAYREPVVDFVDVDGTMIRYALREGSGVPLLLFNGIGANLEITFPFVEAMTGREILVFDVPGTGRSELWLRPRRFRGIARLARGLLDRLGYREIDAAGISWGGALAQQFARDNPGRCRRLILAATAAGFVMVPGRPAALARMATPRRYLSAHYMMNAAPHIYGGETRHRPRLVHEHTARIIPPRITGYLYQLIAGLGWTSVHWLHRLSQPTLIMAGDDDPLVPAVNARFMAMLIPDNELHIVPGGGHLFMLNKIERVRPIIERFLDAPSAPAEAPAQTASRAVAAGGSVQAG